MFRPGYFKRITFYIVALLATFLGCSDALEYSPNQQFDNDSPKDLNATNLKKLHQAPKDDTITIAFIGDSQRFYDELEGFANKVKTIPSVDFIILAGDISDFGLLQEFEWVSEILSTAGKPYISVIGNHDVVANGEEVFKRMFGELNFSFVYDSVKFIFHNTNSREYRGGNVPDLNWLGNELYEQDSAKYFIAVSHVPPFDNDFNQELIQPYTKLFSERPGFLLSLHGHIHRHKDEYPYEDGVRYMTTHSFNQRSFVLLQIVSGTVHKKLIDY